MLESFFQIFSMAMEAPPYFAEFFRIPNNV
jgi:hypothetical protein